MSARNKDVQVRVRDVFAPLFLENKRWACVVAHRRCGKTVACIQKLVLGALQCGRPNPRFAYIAPFYKQAKDVAWAYLKEFTADIPGAKYHETELRVDFLSGARIRLYGADNPDALRGIYLDGVILDEFADMNPRTWSEVIRPALADRKGWAVFIGTPKGRNEFFNIHSVAQTSEDWTGILLKASETGLVDDDELRAAQILMTEEQYEQEFECSFQAAIQGAFYGRMLADLEQRGRFATELYDPEIPVDTAWDFGHTDDTAIWFVQIHRGEVRVIDYYATHGEDIEHYAKVLQEKPYSYDRHWVPHDARAKVFAAAGKTIKEQAATLGITMTVVEKISVQQGIQAVRMMLPQCWFDQDAAADGIECLRQYQREWDDDKKVFRKTPLHNWASHGADAFRMLAVAYRERMPKRPEKPKVPQPMPKTLDQMIKDFEREQSRDD